MSIEIKQWHQWRPNPTALSKSQLERLEVIDKRLKRIEGGLEKEPLPQRDVRWLAKTLRELSRVTPHDFGFPKHAAMIDSANPQLIFVNLKGRVALEGHVEIPPGIESIVAFREESLALRNCDCLGVVRPFLRVLDGDLEEIRTWTFSFWVDEFMIVENEPLDACIENEKGKGLTAAPWTISGFPRNLIYRMAEVRYIGKCKHRHLVGTTVPEGFHIEGEGGGSEELLNIPLFAAGLCAKNEVKLEITGTPLKTRARIRAGFVAALYSTV